MQTTSSNFTQAYEKGYVLEAKPRVIIEWNHNRYSQPTASNNVVWPNPETNASKTLRLMSDENDVYPIKSIVDPFRPERNGITKARVGRARTSRPGSQNVTRTAGANAKYKYWIPPQSSDSVLVGGMAIITYCRPQVVYAKDAWTNKLVIAFEASHTVPVQFTVEITTNGTTWTTVATNPAVDADGRVTLYLQDNGTWGNDVERDNHTKIRGLRANVTRVNKANSRPGVIEVSARLEKNISEGIESVNVNKSVGDPDMIKPLGEMNTNTATIVFDNSTREYDNENAASIYYGLIDRYPKVTIFSQVNTQPYGGFGYESVQQGVFYVSSWGGSDDSLTVTANCSDYTEFLQNRQMPEVLYIGKTAPDIIKDILAIFGFNLFENDSAESVTNNRLPYVWFNEETTAWDAIKEVAEADQGIGYFDEQGWFRYFSREYLHNRAKAGTVHYKLRAIDNTDGLANIEEVSEDFEVEANKVIVSYKETRRNERRMFREPTTDEVGGTQKSRIFGSRVLTTTYIPPSTAEGDEYVNKYSRETNEPNYVPVWSAEGTVALRSTPITTSLLAHHTNVYIPAEAAKTWPYTGMANIQGEVLSWDGKELKYVDENSVWQSATIKSGDEFAATQRKMHAGRLGEAYYTGRLMNVKRGLFGSGVPADGHIIDASAWAGYANSVHWNPVTGYYGPQYSNNSLHIERGTLQMSGHPWIIHHSFNMILKGATSHSYYGYGTTVIFRDNGRPTQSAGFLMNWNPTTKRGYWFELNEQTYLNTAYGPNTVLNVRVYQTNGSAFHFPAGHGVSLPITFDRPYQIHVQQDANNIAMYVDGQLMISFRKDFAGLPLHSGMWGPFIHGPTCAEFDSLYVYNDEGGPTEAAARHGDHSLFFNKITGGFSSALDTRELYPHWYRWPWHSSQVHWFYEEFVPILHEVREFEVKHDPGPVLAARVFSSNSDNAWLDREGWVGPKSFIMWAEHTPFRSKFVIANASRGLAVLNGEDEQLGTENIITQKLLVEGNNLIASDEEKVVEYVNEDAVRTRGPVELTFDNPWIMTESQAKAIGKFIVDHWSEPVDNVRVEGFFNPALQLGDIVTVEFPARSMTPATHKYAVASIDLSIGTGINTNLQLRRLR